VSGALPTLIADGIENPWNARALLDAAAMFASACLFRDRKGLAAAWSGRFPDAEPLRLVSRDAIAERFTPLTALDNLPGAASVYGFRPAPGPRPALIVGNERRGIALDLQAIATRRVEIPMPSRRLTCLNVAAAAAVALYYQGRGGGAPLQASSHPEARRPELLLLGATDHAELGSAIRSAGAFGWERLALDDRHRVWFGVDRAARAEGRAAARRARNPIRVVPTTPDQRFRFEQVSVVTTRRGGRPLRRARRDRGPRQLLVIPDQAGLALEQEDWRRLGDAVELLEIELPAAEFAPRYRLVATITLAEAARQVGQRAPGAPRPRRPTPVYESALRLLAAEQGELVHLDELEAY